jgi:hypothetical protein
MRASSPPHSLPPGSQQQQQAHSPTLQSESGHSGHASPAMGVESWAPRRESVATRTEGFVQQPLVAELGTMNSVRRST